MTSRDGKLTGEVDTEEMAPREDGWLGSYLAASQPGASVFPGAVEDSTQPIVGTEE